MLSTRSRLAAALLVLTVSLIVTATAWGAISVDVTTAMDQGSAKNTVSTSVFSTASGNELLLAFIAADCTSSPNTTVTQVAGGGLTWALVERTNVQKGTAEIWRAFAPSALSGVTVTATLSQKVDSSITVMSFSGVNTSGTNGSGAIGAVGSGNADPGAPTATLVTTANGSLVLGVGNDWDHAIARTLGPNQTMVHQLLATVADTYWVQRQSSTTSLSGTSVSINDTAPTSDRYNLAIVEILAAAGGATAGSISGTISPAANGSGATITLSQSGTTVATTTVGAAGTYSFSSVVNGTYTVTPSNAGYVFAPSSQSVTVNGASITGVNFTASLQTWSIQGNISPSSSGTGATVALTQGSTTIATTTVGAAGTYSFSSVVNGTYTVTPSNAGYVFAPSSQSVTVNGASITGVNFTASLQTWSIQGNISPSSSGTGATVALTQGSTTIATTTVGAAGTYSFSSVVNGTYTVTPSNAGYVFAPSSQSVTVNGASITGVNFTASLQTWSIQGNISPSSSGTGATVALTQGSTTIATTTVGAAGTYSFSSVVNGTYTVTPSNAGYAFAPSSQSVTVKGASITGVSFTASLQTWSIQGNISPSSSGTGATVALTQGSTTVATTTVGAAGTYSFSSVVNGTYTVTPSNAGYAFAPSSQSVTVKGASITGVSFTASLQTWSIQGNISPSSSGTGATVALTQGSTTVATTTVGAAGTYSFSSVVNGTYTVTPSNAGYAFAPSSQSVTVNGAPVTGINFTASALPTYSISGMISPSANGSGATVTLSGTASATTTADTSGAFRFSGLANGPYTVTATKAGFAISPASQPVSVNNAPVTGVNFTATLGLALDVVAYGDTNSPSITAITSAFATTASNELLLAFISADSTASPNTTVTQVAGGGLTWALVERTNVQKGTAEIWRAFALSALSGVTVTATLSQKVDSSITVVSFTGVNTSGTNGSGAIGAVGSGNADPGAPTAALVTTVNGSLVLGVGNDWDNAIARTLGPGQAMVHQFLANVGDTYWVQRESNATSLSGTSVTLNDSAPTSDRYNLTIVEVLPVAAGTVGTYGIFGTLSPSALASGATVTLSGTASGTTTADGSGNYGFSGLSNGSYTVTPSKSGYSFSPGAQSATINGANVAVNFTVSSSPPPVAVSISPTSASVTTGGTQQFTATLQNTSNTAVTWQVNGVTEGNTTTGTISSSGLYAGPGTVPNPATVTVTAISQADPSKSASAQMTITPQAPVSVTISPASATVTTSGIQQFTGTVQNTGNTAVTWSATGGTVSSSGFYTAPGTAGSYTVTATSVVDTSKSASATVTVTSSASSPVLLGDQNVESQADSVSVGQAQAFQATANASGSVQSLVIYLDSTSTSSEVMAGLYADAGGQPGALLSQGSSTQLLSGAWNPILLPATSVVAGTPYWIAILGTGSGTPVLRSATTGCPGESSSQTSLLALPANWSGGGGTPACPLSVFADSGQVIFFDGFAGTTLGSAWTVISRHGEYSQNETECNVPQMVTVDNGLTITTEAQSATCGDYFTLPSSWPYITGDIQWATFNFTYGTVEIEAKFPTVGTSLWPATWMLSTNCQYTNPLTGSTGITIDGYNCPNLGSEGYAEIDMTECFGDNWCQLNAFNPSEVSSCNHSYTVDTNWHLFKTVWNASSISQYLDGNLMATCNQTISSPMFLIIQTQTGGVGGTPNNSLLPAALVVDYVKVTQP